MIRNLFNISCFLLLVLSSFNEKIYGYEHSKDKLIEIIPSNDEDIIKKMPVYEFSEDAVGSFMDLFLGSITEFHYNDPIIIITDTDETKAYYDIELPEDCVFLKLTDWDADIINQSKGVVLLPNDKYGLIFSDNKGWLSLLNLLETEKIFTVKYGKSYITPGLPILNYVTTSYDIWAVLKVWENKKVEPLMIYNILRPIQRFTDMNEEFDWIEDFYKKHNYQAGCGYYNQPDVEIKY